MSYRRLPTSTTPINKERVHQLLEEEWAKFREATKQSAIEFDRAKECVPLGVPSSFQHWDPWPISIASAQGAWMTDVDGRRLLDLSMGFGAMFAGHLNPEVMNEVKKTLDVGTLFVTPSPISTSAAELMCRRFGLEQVRFTNSGKYFCFIGCKKIKEHFC